MSHAKISIFQLPDKIETYYTFRSSKYLFETGNRTLAMVPESGLDKQGSEELGISDQKLKQNTFQKAKPLKITSKTLFSKS